MLYDMRLLLRPSLVGFLVSQPLSAKLLHMANLATVVASDALLTLSRILFVSLSFLLALFTFSLEVGTKGLF